MLEIVLEMKAETDVKQLSLEFSREVMLEMINILTDFKNACYLQILRRTKFEIEQ